MFRYSLRKRVAIAFALCVVVLSIVWGFAFFAAVRLSEDRVLAQQLKVAAENYPLLSMNLRGYSKIESLPESLRAWAYTNPKEGLYEFDAEELHVAVIQTEIEKQKAFIVFDVAGIEAKSSEDWLLLAIISGVVCTLGFMGFGLGVLVMRRAVAPVVELAQAAEDINPKQLSDEDYKLIKSSRFDDDEVGLLAVTIEKALKRITDFVERERNFTSSASHELRTPVTVITGALELLDQSALSKTDIKTVDRIKRATLDMKNMIEMFLCLARESDVELHTEKFLVVPLVNRAIEQQNHLLKNKANEVDVEQVASPRICGSSQAFSITVNNLVKNAFQHSHEDQGPILINIKEHELSITNRRSNNLYEKEPSSNALSSQRYGLGLSMVEQLCERHGWAFFLLIEEKQVTARLSWKQ